MDDTTVPAAPNKLVELVDFVALRFCQLRPEGDPSECAEQLVKQYGQQRGGAYQRLQQLDSEYSAESAAAVIDAAYLSSDGICDGLLLVQRATARLKEMKSGPSSSSSPAVGLQAMSDTVESVHARVETLRLGMQLCSSHLRMASWLRLHSTDSSGSDRVLAGLPPSTPWREVEIAPGVERVKACLRDAEEWDAAPDAHIAERCRFINVIRRDTVRLKRALTVIPALRDVGRDPSLQPASATWARILKLPAFGYEHHLVAAIREMSVHKYCLAHVIYLLNEAPDVRAELADAAARAEEAAATDARQQQQAAAAAEKEKEKTKADERTTTVGAAERSAGHGRSGRRGM